jgi:uncharacterized protein (TIGR01777 family)
MVIALSGYNGFIGSHIQKAFDGNIIVPLHRELLYGDVHLLAERLKGADVVINTAGYSVSSRWNKNNRDKILISRVEVTKKIVNAIKLLDTKPEYFINASAIGLYEEGKEHTESVFSYQDDFLGNVVREWEGQADKISGDVKLVKFRLGLVLGDDGGALPRLLKIFKYGLGGVIGTGKQVYSFIHIDDVIGALKFILNSGGEGAYNFTAPNPVTNREFTRAIARLIKRPAFMHVPGFFLRLAMGKAAMIVTKGQTVYPQRLLDEGYNFTFDTIEKSINNILIRGESN